VAAAVTGHEVLGGGGALAVDVGAIGRELRRLWAETAEASDDQARPVITRACTRNLVVLAGDHAQAAHATRLVASLAGMHPTRAFVVEAVAGDPARLEAWLTAHCSIRAGGRHVCCEQISLAVGADARRRAAGTIVPLLVPDLPVFVWALGTPDWEDPLLARLLDVADRLVVDTRAASDEQEMVRGLGAAQREDAWAPGDFEWSRLAGWREAVAAMFDEPATRPVPERIDRVHVQYCAGGGAIGAARLAGWALDRLDAARARAPEAGAAPPVAELEAVHGASPGDIVGVRMTAAGVTCEVRIEEADSGLTSRVDLEDACPLPARHPNPRLPDEHLLEDQLDMPGPSPIYERAFVRAAALLRV
jgi:glucose-6-phosphate dehydrogenase assembly protein OpcA